MLIQAFQMFIYTLVRFAQRFEMFLFFYVSMFTCLHVHIDVFHWGAGGAAAPLSILAGYLLGQKWKIFMAKKDFHDTY